MTKKERAITSAACYLAKQKTLSGEVYSWNDLLYFCEWFYNYLQKEKKRGEKK